MTDRPILFSAPMVRALLDGKKTQTRRLLKPKKHACLISEGWTDDYVLDPGNREWLESYYRWRVGDRLWVRERFRGATGYDSQPPSKWGNKPIWYDADGTPDEKLWWHLSKRSRPGIHMPRWASRLTLTVTDVRVQRLHDISGEDAVAEGINPESHLCGCERCAQTSQLCPATSSSLALAYGELWDRINGAGNWDANPWVVAVSFRTVQHNIDQVSRLTVSCTDAGSMRA